MGRRALPKIDPTLDLSRHLKTLEDLPKPWDSKTLFGRSAPLEVEVGSGKGLFMQTAASHNPEKNFLGIEIGRKYAQFAAAGLASHELTNGVMIAGDGIRLFSEYLPDNSLDAVHVYFPDPWWKLRHRRRRVMQEPLLHDIQRALIPGGTLHFWTDVQEYYKRALKIIAGCTNLEGPLPVDETPAEHDLDYRTHFERRTRLHSEAVYRSKFRKPVE